MTVPPGPLVPRHIVVPKTARYWTQGPEAGARDVWFVLHGYGQLAVDFLRGFEPLADGTHLFVSPEGLSRFYHKEGRGSVGASWMTREDREVEIADYVGYFDRLYQRVIGTATVQEGGPTPRVRVLGFSQGLAAALRWATLGRNRVDHLILWAGGLPNDLDLVSARAALAGTRVTLVAGLRDKVVGEGLMVESQEKLLAAGIPGELYRFDGGHRLDRETLRRLAAD